MAKVSILATRRTVTGKQVGVLRRAGKLPAILYGRHLEATPITLDLRDASKILATMTSSSLVNIDLEGETHSALVFRVPADLGPNLWLGRLEVLDLVGHG